jgi:hypothetical protein
MPDTDTTTEVEKETTETPTDSEQETGEIHEESTEETPDEESNEETGGSGGGGGSGGSEVDAFDWDEAAEKIANALQANQSTFETIVAVNSETEYRIVHEATTGDLLVSGLLLTNIAIFLLKWLFVSVWRR